MSFRFWDTEIIGRPVAGLFQGLKGGEVRWEWIETHMRYGEIETASKDKYFDNYGHEVEKIDIWWLKGG